MAMDQAMLSGHVIQGYSQDAVLVCLFAGMALATIVLTRVAVRLAHRIGAVDRGGYRRINNRPIPRMGGFGVAAPICLLFIILSAATYLGVRHWQVAYRHSEALFQFVLSVGQVRRDLFVLAIGSAFIVALGVIDDSRGMRARMKLLGQVAAAVFVCLMGYQLHGFSLPLIGYIHCGPVLGFVISVAWIVGLINAFNLIDGMDGLATGIALIASVAIMAVGLLVGDLLMVLACTALAGSLAAFLRFNFPPAKVFLGDTGSMFLGFFLGSLTLMGSSRMDTALVVVAPLMAMAFPLFETAVTIARRAARGAPLFTGDARHTHHRLLESYSTRTVILLLYTPAIIFASSAIISQLIPVSSFYNWVPLFIVFAGLFWICWLAGYFKPSGYGYLAAERQRNRELNALSRYISMALSRAQTLEKRNALIRTCCEALDLQSLTVWFAENEEVIADFSCPESGREPLGRDARVDPKEQLRVPTHLGYQSVLSLRFNHKPTEAEHNDAMRTLAQIFENLNLKPTQAKVVNVSQDASPEARQASEPR